MSGLVGIILKENESGNNIPGDIEKMVQSISHFDDYLIDNYLFKKNSIAFSNVSLNIPNFPTQNYSDKERKIHTILDGEILNIEELRDELLPDQTVNNNGAKLINFLYLQYSDFHFLEKLNGWYNLIIYDEQKDLLVMANDRYGFRPIYYKVEQEKVIFSSEVKAILSVSSQTKELDNESISNYFVFRGILNEKTFFKNIFRFPPASLWKLHKNNWQKSIYWDINNYTDIDSFSENEIYDHFNELFKKIIKRYFKDNYLMSLTGGWDTRTMMSLIDYGQKPDSCFTYGLSRNSAENILAKKVAKILKIPHEFITINDNFLNNFAYYAEKAIWISDGMGDITASSILFVHEKHRNNICVGGKYGNQIALTDKPQKKYNIKKTINLEILAKDFYEDVKNYPAQSFDKAYKRFNRFEDQQKKDIFFSIYELCRHYWGDRLAIENSMLLMRTPYTDNDLIGFLLKLPVNLHNLRSLQKYIICKNNIKLAKIPTDSGSLPQSGDLLKMIWAGFFKFWYYSTKISNYKKIPPKLRLDQTFLANNTTAKFANWFRDKLNNYIRDMILDKKTLSRDFFDSNILRRIVKDHIDRKRDHTDYIKKIISFELFLRQFMD